MSRRSERRRMQEQLTNASSSILRGGSYMSETTSGGRTSSISQLILDRSKYLNGPSKPTIQVTQVATPQLPISGNANAATTAEIISSDRHKEMIWNEAQENRAYYKNRQLTDGNRLPWFRHVRKESQYSEFVMLDGDMAKSLLDNMWSESEGNRHLKPGLKDSYLRDLLSDRWIPSDESLGIDFKGIPYNGKHRLTALIESKKEWPFYMTFNALEEAKFTVDSGAKRNSAEKLKLIIDTKLGNRTVGFCKAIMRGLQSRVRYTETEIAEFAFKWKDLVEWIYQHIPRARAEVQAAIGKAYLWYGPELVEPFCDRLRELHFVQDGDPAKALFVALQRAKVNRINQALVAYRKTLAAIDAVVTNKELYKLYEKDEDIFQWQADWELPPKK